MLKAIVNQQHHKSVNATWIQNAHIRCGITQLPLGGINSNNNVTLGLFVSLSRLMQEDKAVLSHVFVAAINGYYGDHLKCGILDRRSGGVCYDYTLEVVNIDSLLYVIFHCVARNIFHVIFTRSKQC